MQNKIILLLITVVSLAGCRSKPEAPLPSLPAYPKPGTALNADDLQRVRTQEVVKTYYVGRLPSADGRSMRGAHQIYVLSQDATWDTRPNADVLPLGPQITVRDLAYQPMPVSAESAAEVERQALARKRAENAALQAETLNAQLRADYANMAKSRAVVRDLRSQLETERTARAKAEAELSHFRADGPAPESPTR